MDENMLSEDGEWWWDGNNWLPVENTEPEKTMEINQVTINTARSVNPVPILFAGLGLFVFNIYTLFSDYTASLLYVEEQFLWLGFFLFLSFFDLEKISFERITNLDWKVLGLYFIVITLAGLVIFSSSTN
jgi:hypothetical protein